MLGEIDLWSFVSICLLILSISKVSIVKSIPDYHYASLHWLHKPLIVRTFSWFLLRSCLSLSLSSMHRNASSSPFRNALFPLVRNPLFSGERLHFHDTLPFPATKRPFVRVQMPSLIEGRIEDCVITWGYSRGLNPPFTREIVREGLRIPRDGDPHSSASFFYQQMYFSICLYTSNLL